MRAVSLLAGFVVTGCQAEPRSAAYFEAHSDEAAKAVAACREGRLRDRECDTAAVGLAAVQANRRLKVFHENFE